MTLASTPPIITYAENGGTVVFAVPFQFIAAADLVVVRQAPDGTRTTALLGADYSVAGGAGATGSVTVTAAKPTGWTIEISRFTARTQPLDLTPGDSFPAESMETALGRNTAIAQEIEAKLDGVTGRAVLLPVGKAAVPFAPVSGAAAVPVAMADGSMEMLTLGSFPAGPAGSIEVSGIEFVTSEQFGAQGAFNPDTFTGPDDRAAFGLMLSHLATRAVLTEDSASQPYYKAMPPAWFLNRGYRLSDTLFLNDGCYHLKGERGASYGGGTVFFLDAGKTGIVLNNNVTTGENGIKADTPPSAAGSSIEGIRLYSLGGAVASPNDGYRIKGFARLRDISAVGFSGAGINLAATSGSGVGTTEGNNNTLSLEGGEFIHNMVGISESGADSNVHLVSRISSFLNKTFGILARGFLGNVYVAPHLADNGTGEAGPAWLSSAERLVCAQCHSSGQRYYLAYGQAAAATTTAPSGTTASNGTWIWMETGGAHAAFPTWAPGMSWRDGGAYYNDNASGANVLLGPYAESSQPPIRLGPSDLSLGGFGSRSAVGGAALNAGQNTLYTFSPVGSRTPDSTVTTFLFSDGARHIELTAPNYPLSYSLMADGVDLAWSYASSGSPSNQPFGITGPTTANPIGAHRLIAKTGIGLGAGANCRLHGAPIAAQSDLNGLTIARGWSWDYLNPAAGGKRGAVCTTAGVVGSTAVLKDYGVIDA